MTPYDVFISYNWHDAEAVEKLARALRDRGLNPFLDRWYLVPGLPWTERLEQLVGECRSIAICVGPSGLGHWQRSEMDLALVRQKREPLFPVIPVLLPIADPPSSFLTLNTWVDFRTGIDSPTQVDILCKAVRGEPPSPNLPKIAESKICPYRSLRAFREDDAPFFYGRESFVSQLVKTVEERSLIALVGASGSGKSSVVFAGLAPKLRHLAPNSRVWEITDLRPGDRPFHSLAASLLPLLEPELSETDRLIETPKLANGLIAREIHLRDIVNRILSKLLGTDRLLLIADQFEELYALCNDEKLRHAFLEELIDAASYGNVCIILTLRADFFSHILEYRRFSDVLQGSIINLGPMNGDELRLSISEPARQVGVSFETDLVERILDDVGTEPGNLPLLEFALTEMWIRRRAQVLSHETYRDIGAAKGAIVNRAEKIYGDLNKSEQESVRQIFIQLVQPGEGTEDTSRRALMSEIVSVSVSIDEKYKIIKTLSDARLAVTGKDEISGKVTVEVAHEALIHGWKRLKDWMMEDRTFRSWQERLRFSLQQWETNNRDEGGLLRGTQLIEAEYWLRERSPYISQSEKVFINSGISLREKERATRESFRRLITVIATGAAIIFLILAGIAATQWRIAEQQKQVALARQLAARSELLRSQQSDLLNRSVLLSVEAMKRAQTVSLEFDYALRNGLALLPNPLFRLDEELLSGISAFSPDGRYIATTRGKTSVAILEIPSGHEIARFDHDLNIWAIAFSPNGLYLATVTTGTTLPFTDVPEAAIRIWSIGDHRQVAKIQHAEGIRINALSFSPDSKYLATAGNDNTAQLWEVPSGRWVARMQHDDHVVKLAFSPDGHFLATASGNIDNFPVSPDRSARVWEIPSGREIARMQHDDSLYALSFSPDGKYIATGSWDRTVRLWDAHNGHEVRRFDLANEVPYDVSFSPDGNYIAVGSSGKYAHLYEVSTGLEKTRFPHESEVFRVTFSANGQYLATTGSDQTIRIWEIPSGLETWRIVSEGKAGPGTVNFSPDGKYLSASGWVWQLSSSVQVVRLINDDESETVALSADGHYLASASRFSITELWSLDTTPNLIRKIPGSSSSVAFNVHDNYLATGSVNNGASVWDVISGREVIHVAAGKSINGIAFNPDGNLLATSEDDGTIIVWNIATGNQLINFNHAERVDHLVFRPDGRYLATAGFNGTARIWDLTKGIESIRITHGNTVSDVDYSPDGKYLVTASWDQTARLWDASNGKELMQLPHQASVWAVAFSHDGKYIATGDEKGIVRVWDVITGNEIERWIQPDVVTSVAFSQNGKYLATGSWDRIARMWLLWPDDLINQACSRLTRNLSLDEWKQYLGDEPYRKTCPNLP